MEQSISSQCKRNRRLWTADCGLGTAAWGEMQTESKKWRLQTRGKMQTINFLTESSYRSHY